MEAFGLLVAHGVQPDAFWDMSWGEIREVSKGIAELDRQDMQLHAVMAWKTADLVRMGVAALLSKGGRFPALQDAFPGVFDAVGGMDSTQDWRAIQAQMQRKADVINSKRAGR